MQAGINDKLVPFTQPKRKMCWWITEKCNEGCIYCFRSLSARNTFSYEDHAEMLRRIISFGTEQITWSGGEALLVEHVPELMRKAQDCGIYNKVTTNGKLLTADMIECIAPFTDLVALSIDSMDDEVNRQLGRGAEHASTVIARMEALAATGVRTDVNTVVTALNIDTLDGMAEFFEEHPLSGKWKLMTFFPVREQALANKARLELPDELFMAEVRRLIEEHPDIDIRYMMNDQIQQQYPGVRANGDVLVTRHAEDRIIGNILSSEEMPNPFEVDW